MGIHKNGMNYFFLVINVIYFTYFPYFFVNGQNFDLHVNFTGQQYKRGDSGKANQLTQ